MRDDILGIERGAAALDQSIASGWNSAGYNGQPRQRAQVIDLNPPRPLRVVNVLEFCVESIPEREPILEPWLLSQGLGMVFSWRGIGKTHFALGIAYAVASGGQFLNWKAPKARRVLYLDGEMPAIALQERLKAIVAANGENFEADNLRILTPDFQQGSMPDLATPEGQAAIEAVREGAELIIVDNLSTLARDTRASENDAESWLSVQAWALRLRREGCSVLFIHHAGKGGEQRGTSKREDVLDTVIQLKRPSDYRDEEGARFEVHFKKARHLIGSDASAFEARLESASGTHQWAVVSVEETTFNRVIDLSKEGFRANEIAAELGINKSTVSRHCKAARELGLLPKKEHV